MHRILPAALSRKVTEGRRADANARLDGIRRGVAEAEREAWELEEALGRLALLKREDLAGYSPEMRRELYGAVDLEALACGKTVWISGLFLHEGKYISEHFAAKDEVRLTSENYT